MESVNDRYASDEEMGVVLIDDKDKIRAMSESLCEVVQDWYDDLTLEEQRFYRANQLDVCEDLQERLL